MSTNLQTNGTAPGKAAAMVNIDPTVQPHQAVRATTNRLEAG